MENYKKKIKRRALLLFLAILCGIAIAVAAYFVALNRGLYPDAARREYMTGFLFGVLTAWVALIAVQAIRYLRLLKNDEALRQLRIKEEDERTRLILEKAGGLGFNIALGALSLGGIIAWFFSPAVAITLMAVLLFMALVKGSLKLYYHHRY